MSRIEIIHCDGCGQEIEDGAPVTSIMVPDVDRWFPLDLCSGECVLAALGYTEDQPELPFDAPLPGEEGYVDVDPLLEELTKTTPLRMRRRERQPEGMDDGLSDETYEPEPPKKKLSPDELMENEKRYREQAQEVTSGMTGVKSRTMGMR